MHVVRRISRSANLEIRGDFDRPFFERRTSGCLGFFVANNDATPSSRNPVDRTVIRNLTLSRLITRSFSTSTKKKEPPEPRGIPFFGTMLSLIMAGGAQKLHEYVDRRHRELGPVYREQIGPVQGVFVNSPDEFRRIFLGLEGPMPQHFLPEAWTLYNEIRSQRRGLLFMDGVEWLQFRRILNKTMLQSDPAKQMFMSCQKAAENLIDKWKNFSELGFAIPSLEHQLYLWSIETMLATLLGSQWHEYEYKMHFEATHLALVLHEIFVYSTTLSMLPAKLAMKLKLPVWTKFVQTADTILGKVHKLVPEMIRLNGDGLLSMMMKDGIRNEDATRIVADFIIAAGDTTAITMQWALLLLSSRPDLQDQLFNDIKDLSLEETLQHQLLRGVWREALRLHPVAPFITRYLPEDSTIGDYFVSKGDLILLSIYSSGRNENDFPQPNEFRPERWIRQKESGQYQDVKNPFGTLPFAMGARSCIGRKLAETQMSLTLAQLIKTFKIDCENRHKIKMILHLISVPSRPIKLKVTLRKT